MYFGNTVMDQWRASDYVGTRGVWAPFAYRVNIKYC